MRSPVIYSRSLFTASMTVATLMMGCSMALDLNASSVIIHDEQLSENEQGENTTNPTNSNNPTLDDPQLNDDTPNWAALPVDDGQWPKPLKNNNVPFINNSNSVIASYFVEWGIYGRDFEVADIPASNLTHLLYGFIPICGPNPSLLAENPSGHAALQQQCATKKDFEITVHDRYAALEKTFPNDQWDDPLKGNFGQLARLKSAQPDLVILPSIGGWTLSDPFYYLDQSNNRATFVESVKDFLIEYPFFDGVDIDWEYPGGGGANVQLGNKSDGQSYILLLQALRQMLDNLEVTLGKPLQLTSAIGAAPEKIAAVDYAQAQQYLDYLFMMTYDYHGAWSNNTGHLTNLYASDNTPHAEPYSIENSVDTILAQGVYADKLVIGSAFYGRAWQGIAPTDQPFNETATAPMAHNGFWESGIGDYKVLRHEFMTNPLWQYRWDEQAKAPYLWNKTDGKLISFDDAQSVEIKTRWAQQQGLAGVFAWEIDADNGDLLNAIHLGLAHHTVNNQKVPNTPSYSDALNEQITQPENTTDTSTEAPSVDQPTTPSQPPAIDEANGGYVMNASELTAAENALTQSALMQQVKQSIATRDNQLVEQVSPHHPLNPENVVRVESILTQADWDYLFPVRAPEYSYDNFLKAVAKFPAFCGNYDDGRNANAICRASLATMFAHFTQETGGHSPGWSGIAEEWRQGLVHVREMGWDETMRGGYNGECNPSIWQGQTWPCGTFSNGDYKSYFGRGAKQLSYNYNYGPFSEAMFGDVRVLLDHPELVADTWLNLASAVFFFVYPQPPKPSMLHVIDGTWQPNERDQANGLTRGFGVTTQIINGGVECGGSVEIAQSKNRISYYRSFSSYLGHRVQSNEVLGCANMKQFDAQGAGALAIYWEQNWDYVAQNPNGESFACKLVGYQTPFSAFKVGDYQQCVQHHFNVEVRP